MAEQIKTTGMVLLAAPVGEFDKRLVILTKEYGKVTAFVKGARRAGSRYAAVSQPFSFGEFTLYPGKESFGLTDADIKEYFYEVNEDIDLMSYGFYFLELAEYFSVENTDGSELIRLLYVTLKTLIKKREIPLVLVRRVYELKLLTIMGIYPNVFECIRCGSKEKLTAFSFEGPGCVCEKCKKEKDLSVSESLVYTMQFIISSNLGKVYSFTLSESVFKEFDRIMERLVKQNVHKEMKSLEIINK